MIDPRREGISSARLELQLLQHGVLVLGLLGSGTAGFGLGSSEPAKGERYCVVSILRRDMVVWVDLEEE